MSSPDTEIPKYTGWIVSVLSFLSALLMFIKNHSTWSKRIEELENWKTETTTTLGTMQDQLLQLTSIQDTMKSIDNRLKNIEEAHKNEQFADATAILVMGRLEKQLETWFKKN